MDEQTTPRNLFLVGPMGSGKTTVGERLAPRLGLDFHDLDALLVARAGVSVTDIFEREGETGFRAREAALLEEITARRGVLVATGGGCVLDPENRRRLRERGFPVYLHTPVALQLKRLRHDRRRPLLRVADRKGRLEQLMRQRDPLYREVARLVVESADVPAAGMARRVLQALAREAPWLLPEGLAL